MARVFAKAKATAQLHRSRRVEAAFERFGRAEDDPSDATVGDGLMTGLQAPPEQSDVAERAILEKVAAGTASKDDLLALGTLLWRRLHPDVEE